MGFVTLGRVCGASDREGCCQPAGPGSARRFSSMVVKSSCQGQLVGKRSVRRRDRFTATAGVAMIRTRRVRLFMGSTSPSIAAQRLKLWAMTAHANQAAFAA